MFRCLRCGKEFEEPNTYEETHGLDTPPYERVAVCAHCSSVDFVEWNPNVEKNEVSAKLLEAIAALNRYMSNLGDLYGKCFCNDDLNTAYGVATEMIDEMYDEFISVTTSRDITRISTNKDIEQVLAVISGV